MASVGTSEPSRLKVFISYSRKDEDFAQELLTGLDLVGFEPYLDKHDIAAGEAWEAAARSPDRNRVYRCLRDLA